MNEKIVEYRDTALDMLSRLNREDELPLSTKSVTLVGYTNAMLREAKTEEELQICAETLKEMREIVEKDDIKGNGIHKFLVGCESEFVKKFLDYQAEHPGQTYTYNDVNYKVATDISLKIYNNQDYGLEVLKEQIVHNLDGEYRIKTDVEKAGAVHLDENLKKEIKYTDSLVQTLIKGCKSKEDFQNLLEGIQSIQAETPEAKEKLKSISEKVTEKIEGKTQGNTKYNNIEYSNYIRNTLPRMREYLTTPKSYDLEEVEEIQRTLKNIDYFLTDQRGGAFSQEELRQIIEDLNTCMIEAKGILTFASTFEDGIHLDWTNWRNRVNPSPALASALLASERIVRTEGINEQATNIRNLTQTKEKENYIDEGGRQ